MRDRLLHLRERLLVAGISPRQVERYLRELSEHRDDIAEHLRKSGHSAAEAHRQADHRLGDGDVLLVPMLVDSRFRSRAARWPALFYVALPLLVQVSLMVAGVVALVGAAGMGLRPAIADLGTGMALLLLASPIVIAWLMLLAALRRRSSLGWPISGAVALALLGAAFQIAITAPGTGVEGQISLTLGTPPLVLPLALFLLSLLPLSLQRRSE